MLSALNEHGTVSYDDADLGFFDKTGLHHVTFAGVTGVKVAKADMGQGCASLVPTLSTQWPLLPFTSLHHYSPPLFLPYCV